MSALAIHPRIAGRFDAPVIGAQAVPSGQKVELFDVLIDEVGTEDWLRFRFLAPAIGKQSGDMTYEKAMNDFSVLCAEVALPYMVEFDLRADVIVISLLDRPVAFGASDPDVTQFVEAFRADGSNCVMESDW